MQTKKNNLLSNFHMQIERELLRRRTYFAISVVLEKIRRSWKKKFCNLSAGSLLNTQNKCLYSIRGTLSRSGGSEMDQFSVIHNRLKNLLFFLPPQQIGLFCFLCLRKKRNTGKMPALLYRPRIINLNAWPVVRQSCAFYNNRVAQPGAFGFSRTFIKRCWRTRRLWSCKQALAHMC